MYVVAIESSCDETAVSIANLDCFLQSQPWSQAQSRAQSQAVGAEMFLAEEIASQVRIHKAYGGVVPELAARQHVTSLPILFEKAVQDAGIELKDIGVVAVTRGPGLKGCLLVGLSYAKALAYGLGKPLLPLHHLEGHIFASELADNAHELDYPRLALIVSGGHTMLIRVSRFREYQIIVNTRDDAAGEAFDKSATVLGLPYPGGPALSARAQHGLPGRFTFPIGVPNDPKSFSFSGFKTAVVRKVESLKEQGGFDEQTVSDVACGVQEAIVQALVTKTAQACQQYRPKSVLLSGGVAANSRLRAALAEELAKRSIPFIVPSPKWCTDNGSMMAVLAGMIVANNPNRYLEWKRSSSESLGPSVGFDIGSRPRWSIEDLW